MSAWMDSGHFVRRHTRRQGLLLMMTCGLVGVSTPSFAGEMGAGLAWLVKANEAAAQRNYQGTVVVSSGSGMSSSRVLHVCDGAQQFERIDALDGEPRSMIRENDTVYTLWPRTQLLLQESRDGRPNFPALAPMADRNGLEWYEFRFLGADRIAGREADVVWFKARDALRFSQRYWSDRETGLVLRADVLSVAGQVLESEAFSEVTLGQRGKAEQVMGALRKASAYRKFKSQGQSTTLEAEGWLLSGIPAGFKVLQLVRRPLDQGITPEDSMVVQAILSDGMVHVSLFLEPYQSVRHQTEVHTAVGATHTLMQRQGDQWITLIGDVPADTLKRLASGLERRR